MKTVVTQLDSRTEVSALVIKAYIVSLLMLLCVLVWSVGDAWTQYAQEYNMENELASMVVLYSCVVHISLQMGLQAAPRYPCDTFLRTWPDRLLNLSNYGGTLWLQEMFEPAFNVEKFGIQALSPKSFHQTGYQSFPDQWFL